MIVTEIKASEWKPLERGMEAETPTWLKLPNGNIVLAVWRDNGSGTSGWWKCFIEDGQFRCSTGQGYMAKGAEYQPALPSE